MIDKELEAELRAEGKLPNEDGSWTLVLDEEKETHIYIIE